MIFSNLFWGAEELYETIDIILKSYSTTSGKSQKRQTCTSVKVEKYPYINVHFFLSFKEKKNMVSQSHSFSTMKNDKGEVYSVQITSNELQPQHLCSLKFILDFLFI